MFSKYKSVKTQEPTIIPCSLREKDFVVAVEPKPEIPPTTLEQCHTVVKTSKLLLEQYRTVGGLYTPEEAWGVILSFFKNTDSALHVEQVAHDFYVSMNKKTCLGVSGVRAKWGCYPMTQLKQIDVARDTLIGWWEQVKLFHETQEKEIGESVPSPETYLGAFVMMEQYKCLIALSAMDSVVNFGNPISAWRTSKDHELFAWMEAILLPTGKFDHEFRF